MSTQENLSRKHSAAPPETCSSVSVSCQPMNRTGSHPGEKSCFVEVGDGLVCFPCCIPTQQEQKTKAFFLKQKNRDTDLAGVSLRKPVAQQVQAGPKHLLSKLTHKKKKITWGLFRVSLPSKFKTNPGTGN